MSFTKHSEKRRELYGDGGSKRVEGLRVQGETSQIQNVPVLCVACSTIPSSGRDQLCSPCRGRRSSIHLVRFWKKYHFGPAEDKLLRQAYAIALDQAKGRRPRLSQELKRLAADLRVPKQVLVKRAEALGITIWSNRRWTKEELEILEHYASSISGTSLVQVFRKRGFNRSYHSLRAKLATMQRSIRVQDGYSIEDLAALFGVSSRTVARWESRGWIIRSPDLGGRFPEDGVYRFMKEHAEEWQLRKLDEDWGKGILLGGR